MWPGVAFDGLYFTVSIIAQIRLSYHAGQNKRFKIVLQQFHVSASVMRLCLADQTGPAACSARLLYWVISFLPSRSMTNEPSAMT